MKRHEQSTGVRKWSGDDLLELQSEALTVLDGFFGQYGDVVIKGCAVSGGTIASGLVNIGGKVMPFAGATNITTYPIYLISSVSSEQREYVDGAVKDIAKVYTAITTQTKPTSDYIEIPSDGSPTKFFDKVDSTWLTDLKTRLSAVESYDVTIAAALVVLSAAKEDHYERIVELETQLEEFPDSFPNPYPLVINGTSYDGSEAVNINIYNNGGTDSSQLAEVSIESLDIEDNSVEGSYLTEYLTNFYEESWEKTDNTLTLTCPNQNHSGGMMRIYINSSWEGVTSLTLGLSATIPNAGTMGSSGDLASGLFIGQLDTPVVCEDSWDETEAKYSYVFDITTPTLSESITFEDIPVGTHFIDVVYLEDRYFSATDTRTISISYALSYGSNDIIDGAPTADSTNLVTSGGVYNSMDTAAISTLNLVGSLTDLGIDENDGYRLYESTNSFNLVFLDESGLLKDIYIFLYSANTSDNAIEFYDSDNLVSTRLVRSELNNYWVGKLENYGTSGADIGAGFYIKHHDGGTISKVMIYASDRHRSVYTIPEEEIVTTSALSTAIDSAINAAITTTINAAY